MVPSPPGERAMPLIAMALVTALIGAGIAGIGKALK